MYKLTDKDKNGIITGAWLQDTHMDIFGYMLANNFDSSPEETWKLQCPEYIEEKPVGKQHIQILFSGTSNIDGHWVCSYYDGKSIYIFDSLNKKKLHKDHKIFLNKLFPFYNIEKEKNIKFPVVQQQPNGSDCGVFAIAFVTSLLFNIKPDKIKYDHAQMRSHLLKMLQTQKLEHFPQSMNISDKLINILPLNVVKYNRSEAERKKSSRKYESKIKISNEFERKSNNLSFDNSKIHDNVLSAKSDRLATNNNALLAKSDRLATNNNALLAKSDRLATKDRALSAESDRQATKNKALSAKSDRLATKNNALLAKSDRLATKDKALLAKSDRLATKNNALLAKSDSLATKDDALLPKSDRLATRNDVLSAKSDRLATKDDVLSAKSDRLNTKNNELSIEIEKQGKTNNFVALTLSCANDILSSVNYREVAHENILLDMNNNKSDMNQAIKNNILASTNNSHAADIEQPDISSIVNIDDCECKLNREKQEKILNTSARNKIYYASNKLKIQQRRRIQYNSDIVNMQARKRKQYFANLEENRKKKRMRFASNQNENRRLKRMRYALNRYENRKLKRMRYALNRYENRRLKRIRYLSNAGNREYLKRIEERHRKSYNLDIVNKRAQRRKQYHANLEEYRKKKLEKLNPNRRTNFFIRANTTIQNSVSIYIRIISKNIKEGSLIDRRIEAQRLIKWCLYIRKNYLTNISKYLQFLRDKAELYITQLAAYTDIDVGQKENILCGDSKHTSTSEAFFFETTYNDIVFPNVLIMNKIGQVTNILPLMKKNNSTIKKSWQCSEFCRIKDLIILNRYEKLLETVFKCKQIGFLPNVLHRLKKCTVQHFNNKLGHCHECYVKPEICHSLFLAINLLSPHFPRVRSIERLINLLNNNINKLAILDEALKFGKLSILNDLIKSAEENAKTLITQTTSDIDLNEDRILSTYSLAFNAMTKRSMDMPRLVCVSCERLYCRKDITDVSRMRKLITGDHWKSLMLYLKKESIDVDFVCNYCIAHFRKNRMPPACILNHLIVHEVPEIFCTLNDYEKILIQRAKAFQCVQRMGTVASKKIPHRQMIPKLKGRIFHLPLPIEESLKKICPSSKAINSCHEMYILVRGIPSKSKIVWENLVDVKKVYEVLKWLKENNPLYSEIVLPDTYDSLLNDELHDVEFSMNEKKVKEKKVALLTQITDPNDSYYEHYSIYPMYEKRVNKSSTDLYQMLKVEALPIDNRHKQLDLLCFPDLYCYGVNGLYEERQFRIRDFDFAKLRLMSKHSQFRLNIQYLFFLLNNANMRQINSGIYHKLNTINPRDRYTAGEFLKSMSNKELEGSLDTIFGKLPNTKQYWRRVRNDVNAMTREYGPATWFLTLSPAEWLWSDIADYIKQVSPSLASVKSVNELIALDPVSAARFLQIKFLAMLDFICSSDNPIGKVKHFFVRREYQNRGTPHCHLMIWIEDAPIIGKSSNEEVIRFISQYVTCTKPSGKISPMLYRRVTTHQNHYHNAYCLRTKKTNKGLIKRCRFGFPRPITDKLIMRDIAESIANRRELKSRSRLYDIPRRKDEQCINDYNPAILTAWEGNMDIQFIGEQSAILNWYCTKYTTKTENSFGVDTFDIVNSTKSLRSSLWNIALRSLNNRECGALEAADSLLGIPLHSVDRNTVFRWLDVNQIRSRKIKTRKEIEKLDEDSTDIFCHSFIDNFYPNRPKELELCNLYDFAKWYDVFRAKPSGKFLEFHVLNSSLYLKKRTKSYLINHYTYNMNIQPEKYYYSILLLFKPWRDLSELKGDSNTYAEAFASVKENLMDGLQYHERIEDIQKAFDHVKELINEKIKVIENQNKKLTNSSVNQLDCRPLEAENVMQELKDIENKVADMDVMQMIQQLNTDQKRIFDNVTSTISCDSDNVLRLFVSGEGGTGKSFLIKTIRCWIKQVMNKNTAVTAPTGIAAFNIDGLTIHRLFQLPVEHGQTPKYKSLSDTVLKTLRTEFQNTVLFIIDEVSMISNIMLMYINLRLIEIFDTAESDDGWFGKKHILLFGDLLQLPPVLEEPPFIKISKSKHEKCLSTIATTNLWIDLFAYDELTINVRQVGDNTYRELLSRIRIGIATVSDIEILKSRQITLISQSIDGRLLELCNYIKELPSETICLLSTCYLCDVLNTSMLEQISQPEIKLIARDEIDCPSYFKKKVKKLLDKFDEDNSRTAGLSKLIIVKIGAKIMLRRNIDVTLGLVNGTIGEIADVCRAPDCEDIESIKILLSSGVIHTIERISCKFKIMDKASVVRYQFPLSLSYGVTIHKSQGLSLKAAIVDAGNTIFSCGQTYVALSRITSLEGLHLINFDPNSIKANERAILEYNRLRKIYKPELAIIDVDGKRQDKVTDFIWDIPKNVIGFQTEEDNNLEEYNFRSIKGFCNSDKISSYANVTMQCILHSSLLRNILLKREKNDVFKILADTYINQDITVLSSLGIRQLLGDNYIQNVQHDTVEFLIALVNYASDINAIIEHRLSHTVSCKTCTQTNVTYERNVILTLPISESRKSMELQEIIDGAFSHWQNIYRECEHCGGNEKITKTNIIIAGEIIVIRLLLFSSNEKVSKIMKYSIKGIPTAKIKLLENTYRVISAIFHHGETINSGHYTTMIRGEGSSWLHINDNKVEKKQWPRGAKDVYIFFLQKFK